MNCELCGKETDGPHKCKRGVNDIADYLELRSIINLVMDLEPHYYWEPKKNVRDVALVAALAETGMRISELLSIEKASVNVQKDQVLLRNVKILKRRKEPIFKDFYLPREGVLGPLTEIFIQHLDNVKKGPIFDISRGRAWQIVAGLTGKWCHYFRSQRISFMLNEARLDGHVVARIQGIKKSSTIDHYSKGGAEQFKDALTPR